MGRWSKGNPTPEAIDKALQQQCRALNREPLRDLIALLVQAQPDLSSLKLWAQKHPDKWGQTINNIARAAGFIQKDMVDVNIHVSIQDMSDAQLKQEVLRKQAELAELGLLPHMPGNTIDSIIDAEYAEVPRDQG